MRSAEKFPVRFPSAAEAAAALDGRVRRTPVEPSPGLSERLGGPVWLKLESQQRTGSFKVRGAFLQISRLGPEARRRGVVTASAGNHGLGVSLAAKEGDVPATVCVPASADPAKVARIRELGTEVRISEFAGFDDTETWARALAQESGRAYLSAFDDPDVIAGNGGTLATEMLEQIPDARTFFLPVGGGGLAAGAARAFAQQSRPPRILACQHERSPALALSLERGQAVTRLPAVETVAGGLEGGIGRLPFAILRDAVDRVVLVSEREIREAVIWMLDRHSCLIEPSAAAGVAAALSGRCGAIEFPAVVALTGGNVGLAVLRELLSPS